MVFSSGHDTRNPSGTVSSKSLFLAPAWPLPGTRRGCIGFRLVPRARQLTCTHHGWLEILDKFRGFPSLGPSIPGVCGVCQGLSLGMPALGFGQSLLSLNSDALGAFPGHEDPTPRSTWTGM